jgi:hypothetical protein
MLLIFAFSPIAIKESFFDENDDAVDSGDTDSRADRRRKASQQVAILYMKLRFGRKDFRQIFIQLFWENFHKKVSILYETLIPPKRFLEKCLVALNKFSQKTSKYSSTDF